MEVDTVMKNMKVRSVVVSRFARVVVESTMVNDQSNARELHFSVKLPESAFITEFQMVVAGKTIHGVVKEKEQARQQYNKARAAGRSGGLVAAKERDTQSFDISANVPGNSSVEFHLVYLELLQRRLGKYDHVILVNPGKVIENFMIEVQILENSGITHMKTVLPFDKQGGRTERNEENLTTQIMKNNQLGKVRYFVSIEDQNRILCLPPNERKVTICYDVTRETLGGEIQLRSGYFVHFFAPKNLPKLRKKVVFVIDCSGSMSGRKMEQTKKAFTSVLKEMEQNDRFNVVAFSNKPDVWKFSWEDKNLLPATERNVKLAIKFVEELHADGGTNLFGAIESGAGLLKSAKREEPVASMMIVLTDGQANTGISDSSQIRANLQGMSQGRFSTFCLGFGDDADEKLLKRLADENSGIYRKIYEDSDADLQLKGFFEEVASPLLVNVKISYVGSSVLNTTRMESGQYFDGSEFVVVGQTTGDVEVLTSSISAFTSEGNEQYEVTGSELSLSNEEFNFTDGFDNFTEKIWAYYTIKELLHKKDVGKNDDSLDERILELALKHKFVTPLTSMVVTLPEDDIARPIGIETGLPRRGEEPIDFDYRDRRRNLQYHRSYLERAHDFDMSDTFTKNDCFRPRCRAPSYERPRVLGSSPMFVRRKVSAEGRHGHKSYDDCAVADDELLSRPCVQACKPSTSFLGLHKLTNNRRLFSSRSSRKHHPVKQRFCGKLTDISAKLELPSDAVLGCLYYWTIFLKTGSLTEFQIEVPADLTVKVVVKKGTKGNHNVLELEGNDLRKNLVVDYHITTVELTILSGNANNLVIKYAQVGTPNKGTSCKRRNKTGSHFI